MEWLLMGTVVVLGGYIIGLKRELRQITQQLSDCTSGKGHKKIRTTLIDKDLEALGEMINEQIAYAEKLIMQQRASDLETRRMIANISHDLRTPLTSIMGYLQVLRADDLPANRREDYLETTYRRAKDLEGMINDFFALSLIESPEYCMTLEVINLENLVCDVLTHYYERFVEKGITPELHLPKEPIRLIVDTIGMRRIVENLLANMLHYTTGNVKISLGKVDGTIVLLFVNEVKGLTEEDVEHLFERFYRADAARGKSEGNTGLGLAIVKELVTKMEGCVGAYLRGNDLHIQCKWQYDQRNTKK